MTRTDRKVLKDFLAATGSYFLCAFACFWVMGSVAYSVDMEKTDVEPVADPSVPGYTLVQCLNSALAHNSTILASQMDLEAQKGVRLAARAVLYPRVSIDASLETENRDLFNNEDNGDNTFREDWRIDLRVERSLITAGVNSGNIKIADLQEEIEYIRLQQAVNDVLFDVKKAFYDILLSRSEVNTQRVVQKLLMKEVDRQEKLFEAGRATKFNILRTKVTLTNQETKLVQAEQELELAAISLADLMGVTYSKESSAPILNAKGEFTTPLVAFSEAELVEMGLRQRPDSRMLFKQAEIARIKAKIARASNIPSLSLFSVSTIRRDRSAGSAFYENEGELAFGLLGNWNIFDGFLGKGQALEQEVRSEKFEIQRSASLRKVQIDVRRAYTLLTKAKRSLAFQKGNISNAEKSVELAKTSVDAGFATQFDVLQATVDLANARNIEAGAKHNYHIALAELEKSVFARESNLPVRAKETMEESP